MLTLCNYPGNRYIVAFNVLAPSYKKASIHWVMNAKREDTRQRRLSILIESSENAVKIPPLRLGGN